MTKTAMRIAIWAGAALVTVGVATAAVNAATNGNDNGVLSASDVNDQLASDGSTAASPAPTGASNVPTDGSTMGVGPAGTQRQVQGGLISFACAGDLAELRLWSPTPGYRADHVVRGPAAVVSVQFESDTADDVTVTVTCVNGDPVVKQYPQADDHGGRGGGGGDDNSGRG